MKSKIHECKNLKFKNMSKKTIILLAVAANVMLLNAQENNTWRLGVQSGFQGNHSKFVGGMDQANARFHQNKFGSNGLSLIARYDINQHWMLTTGMGVSSTGFEFAIAENLDLESTERPNPLRVLLTLHKATVHAAEQGSVEEFHPLRAAERPVADSAVD